MGGGGAGFLRAGTTLWSPQGRRCPLSADAPFPPLYNAQGFEDFYYLFPSMCLFEA